jgi:Protein of unknown function (DUF2586)
MPIPGQTLTIKDPGLGTVAAATSKPLCMGASSAGTVAAIVSCTRRQQAVDAFGEGPLVEQICDVLAKAGGPVLGMRLTGGVAGVASAVTKTAVGSSTGTITVAGAPYDAYEVQVRIRVTGTVATGAFDYSLDDGRTRSEQLTIPSGGTYAIPRSNLTLTFVPGAGPVFFESGDLHEIECTAPYFSTTNLGVGFDAIEASVERFDFIGLAGRPADGTAGATVFGTLSTRLAALAVLERYVGAFMDGGIGTDAAVKAAFSAVTDSRICVAYGTVDMASSKAFAGWGTPKLPAVNAFVSRAAGVVISTDLARVADGSLTGVVEISHDEYMDETLDAFKISTTRTWPNRDGMFLTNANMKSGAGSDFAYWQHRRCMDVACSTVSAQQQLKIGASVDTNADGTIREQDALRWEAEIEDALRDVLTRPKNAEGTGGHVSDVAYSIDRTVNILSTKTVVSTVGIRPRGYAKFFTTEIGFAVDLGA